MSDATVEVTNTNVLVEVTETSVNVDVGAQPPINVDSSFNNVVVVVSNEQGPQGIQGIQGEKGETGSVGATGAQGPKGDTGSAATIGVGTTTTSAAGSSASVTNSGTSSAAVFNFTIPRGDTGATGATGASGVINVTAPITNSGTSTSAQIGLNQSLLSITNSQVSGLGTSSTRDVAATGNASGTQVVKGDDTRLTDSRTPTGTAGGDLTGTYPNPTIAAGAVVTNDIADWVSGASPAKGITTAKIADGAVTVAKTAAPVVNTSVGVGSVYYCDNPATGTGSALTVDTTNKRATWIINHNIGRYPLTIQMISIGGTALSSSGYSYTSGRALTNAVTSATRTSPSTTVRVTSVAHGLSVGDTFSLTGTINVGAAGVFTVSNVVSADQFEYVSGGTSTFNSTLSLQVFRNLGTYATVQFGTSASSFSANNFRAVLIG